MSNLKIIGWTGTLAVGALSAKGLGEFLPASQTIAWAVGGGLEVLNIATIGVLASGNKGNGFTKLVMGALVASTIVLDIAGVAGQLAHGYQADLNSAAAVTTAATAKADALVAADRAKVASLDHQIDGLAQREASTALGLAKARGDRDQIRAVAKAQETIKADRAALNAQRDAAVAKLAEDEAAKGQVAGAAINASSEFAAVQFVAKAFGVDQDRVTYAGLGLMAVLSVLFPVCLMVVGAHGPKAPVITPAPVVPAKPARVKTSKNSKRSEAARKGWETRRRNLAKKTGPRLVAA